MTKMFYPALAAMLFCSCLMSDPSFKTDDVDEGGNSEESSEITIEFGDYETFGTEVTELSSLCMAADGKSLISVSDDKKKDGGLYRVEFDGRTSKMLSILRDLEGVTIDPATKDLYLAVEGEQAIYRLQAPSYEKPEFIAEIENGANDPSGKGLEAITWYKDNTLIAGNQANPTKLSFYSLSEGKVVREVTLNFPSFISDLCYDPVDDLLWISDSKAMKIYIAKTDGTLLKSHSISAMVDYGKAEGLTLDRANGCVWVGCDVTDKLYKLSVKF